MRGALFVSRREKCRAVRIVGWNFLTPGEAFSVSAGTRYAYAANAMEMKEFWMYSPELKPKTVKCLYRVGQAVNLPMTKLAEELIAKSLRQLDKEAICRQCVAEGNQDCGNCLLGELETVKEQTA